MILNAFADFDSTRDMAMAMADDLSSIALQVVSQRDRDTIEEILCCNNEAEVRAWVSSLATADWAEQIVRNITYKSSVQQWRAATMVAWLSIADVIRRETLLGFVTSTLAIVMASTIAIRKGNLLYGAGGRPPLERFLDEAATSIGNTSVTMADIVALRGFCDVMFAWAAEGSLRAEEAAVDFDYVESLDRITESICNLLTLWPADINECVIVESMAKLRYMLWGDIRYLDR